MTPYPYNVLIVDDEPEACMNLQHILSQYVESSLNIMGMAHTTKEAEQKIAALQPDAIFLDIEMPNENAFQFLERIYPFSFEIIFVTAYDEYAIRAFKLNAVDYILKPINIKELITAVERLQERIHYKKMARQDPKSYGELAEQINKRKQQDHIIIKDNNLLESVAFRNISYVKAMGSYSRIFFQQQGSEKSVLMSRSIAEYEELFPADLFFRSHRSFLVNRNHIKTLSREEMTLVMNNGEVLPIGRRRFAELVAFLKNQQDGEA